MLVLSFGTETKDYVSDNSATTFRASRTPLCQYSFVHLQLIIHHCKNKLLVTKSLVLTTWAEAAKVSSLLVCGGGKGQDLSEF